MKTIIGTLVLIALASSMAGAELLKNFKYNGSVEVNAVRMNNIDYDNNAEDVQNFVLSRITLGANFDLNNEISAQITAVKNDRKYGTGPQTAVTGTLDSFNFQEAYLNIRGLIGIGHKLGRQYYGDPGDLVIYYGPLMMPYDPAFTVNAIDGWTGWWKDEKWAVNALLGKANRIDGGTDTNVLGLAGSYKLDKKTNLDIYIYQKMTQNNIGNKSINVAVMPNDNLNVGGIKVGGKYMDFEYGAEAAVNFGKNTNIGTGYAAAGKSTTYQGTALKGNVKYSYISPGVGKFNFTGEYAMGSGDKAAGDKYVKAFMPISSDYRPGLIFGGYHNHTGLANLTTFNVGAQFTPESLKKFTAGARFYDFALTENLPSTGLGVKGKIGAEIDLGLNWRQSDKTSAVLTYGIYTPDKKYTYPQGKSAESQLGLDFMLKF